MEIGLPFPHDTTADRAGFQVSVSVGVAGQIRGFMFIQSDLASALGIANALGAQLGVPIEDPTVLGPMQRAALAELTNQVSGRATMYLSELGVDANITPPTVLTGDTVSMAVAGNLEFYAFAIHSELGDLNLLLGLMAA